MFSFFPFFEDDEEEEEADWRAVDLAPFRLEEVAAVAEEEEEEEEKEEEDKEEREEEEDKVGREVKGFLLSIMIFFVCIAGAEDTSATALARSCSLFCVCSFFHAL